MSRARTFTALGLLFAACGSPGGVSGSGGTGGVATGGATAGGAGGHAGGGSGGAIGTGGAVGSGGRSASGGSASGGSASGGAVGTGGRATGGSGSGGAATGGATVADAGTIADAATEVAPPGMCNGASTGTGAAFTAVTDYTARDGGFGPAVVTRNTGDADLGMAADGTPNKVAIFRPAAAKYGQGGVTHPIIVWGNGSTNTVDIWSGFLSRVASYGFVVVAPEQTQVTADHMNKAIDYVLKLARDPNGADCGKIDTTKIGSTGYSLGGGGAISVGSNARIATTFFFASNGNVKNLKAPWGVIGGELDTIFNWTAINSAVSGSTQPAFGAAVAGIDHNRAAGNAKAQEGYIGWLRWRFMGDKAGHDMFVGAACKICTDTAFSGVVKTATFDAL